MIDFDDFEKKLADANSGIRAAECHGFICALVCMADNNAEEKIQKYLMAEEVAEEMQDNHEYIIDLFTELTEQMHSLNMDLQLLLPDDDNTLETRGIALTEWCQGFLSGLGIGGLKNSNLLPDSCKSLIDDLYKVSRLETDNLDVQGEQGERDLLELIEYVRMGAIHFYDTCHAGLSGINTQNGVVH